MARSGERPDDATAGEAGRDISELVDRAGVGVVELSSAGEFATVSEAFAELSGYPAEELRGRPLAAVVSEGDVDRIASTLVGAEAETETGAGTGHGAPPATVRLRTAEEGELPCAFRLRPLDADADRGFVGVAWRLPSAANAPDAGGVGAAGSAGGVGSDSAWAKSFLSLAEAIPDGIIVLDAESDIQYANPAVEQILGHPPEELVGGSKLDIIPPRLRDVHLTALDRYLDTGERHINWSYVELPGQHAEGREVPLGISLNDFEMDGERYFVGLFRDITPRKLAEREAMTRVAQQEAIAGLGRHALGTTAIDSLLDEAAELVAEMLDAEIGTVLESDDETGELRLRAASGLPPELVGTSPLSATEAGTQAGYALESASPVVVADAESESRFDVPEALAGAGIRSGISVVVGSPEQPWGVLTAYDTEPREFTERDVHVLESVANVLSPAVDRHEYERRIEAQRAQLDAITQVYRVVQDIQRAVVRQSSPPEIERTVCERLVELDAYEFAWIADLNLSDRSLSVGAQAGDGDGYLEELTVGSDEPYGGGPVGEAVRTRETQVVSDVTAAESSAPWRESALERGYRAIAAVPIEYRGTTFGVLGVYAGSADAFGPEVRNVLGTLGGLLGHALAAITQRRALQADAITQVELQIEGAVEVLGFDASAVEPIHLDRIVSAGGGEFLGYGHTTAADLSPLEASSAVESVAVLSADGEERRVEIRWTDPSIGSLVAASGGRLREGLLEDDRAVLTIELPPSAEVKSLVERIEDAHPDVAVTLHQRVTRERTRSSEGRDRDPLGDLTERQRNALEAAYFGGYFEWPRDSSASDVADAMGISGATFSQHLRGAERRLFDRILGADDPA